MRIFKTLSILYLVLVALPALSQQPPKHPTRSVTYSAEEVIPLEGVTAGFSIGYNLLFSAPHEYYLSTDAAHKLQRQILPRGAFVISTVVSFRLGKPGEQTQTVDGNTKNVLVDLNEISSEKSKTSSNNFYKQTTKSRWTLNIGLNIVDISGDVSFNKSIDGGLGLGYMLNDFAQVAFFVDFMRYRQLRSDIWKEYQGNSIPKGAEIYNALDEKDHNLFYTKYFSGLSLKLVFTMNNK